MLNYLEQKHILYEKQFGFRAKHSTNQVILSIVDNIQRQLKVGNIPVGFFLTLPKPLILWIMVFYLKRWKYMVSGELRGIGSYRI